MKNRTLTWLVLLGSACAAYPARRPTSSSTAEAATESRPPTATPIQANTTPAVAAEPPPRTTASAPTAPSDSKFSIPGPSASSPDNSSGSSSALVEQGSVADRQITQDVRRALMDDPALASAAKSVKITTNNGKVTLRGSVKSEKERAAVEAAAKKNAGGGQVENLLEVSP